MGRTRQRGAAAKEKILFPGNKIFNAVLMAVLLVCFVLCFSTARAKSESEAVRWQRQAAFEKNRLEVCNRSEIEGCREISFLEVK